MFNMIVIDGPSSLSAKVQEMLFEAGFSWGVGGKTVQHENCKFLFADSTDSKLCKSDENNYVIMDVDVGGKVYFASKMTQKIANGLEGARPYSHVKIDLSDLLKNQACDAGVKWFAGRYGGQKVSLAQAIEDARKDNHEGYANWLFVKFSDE